MTRFLLALLFLTLTYALVLASFKPWDLLLGGLVSAGLLVWLRPFLFGEQVKPIPDLARRALFFFPFAWAVLLDITAGVWSVALVVLHLRPLVRPGIVAIPIGERSRTGVVVSCLVAGMSPGSVLVDVDWEQGVMLFHLIDASDPDQVRAGYQKMYDRYQRWVFP